MTTKTITQWLIIDWKKEKSRTRQSKMQKSELKANEVQVEVKADIEIPEVDTSTLGVKIDVPKPRAIAAEMEQVADGDLPDWTGVVDDKITEFEADITTADDAHDLEQIEEQVVAQAMLDAPGRPDPANVSEYVHERIMAVGNGENDE